MGRKKFVSIIVRCSVVMSIVIVLTLYATSHVSSVEAESPAFIRIVHASSDVGTVDVFMDGEKLLSSFQYASVSNYLPLPPGSHTIEIALIGKGINAAVITQTLPVSEGKAYTIVALGMQATKNLSLEIFEDNNTIVGNEAKIRLYHLSPDTGSVNVTEDVHKIVGDVAYAKASDYISVPAGTYTFDINIMSGNTDIPISAQLKEWTVTSFFAIGLLKGDPQLRLVTTQTAGTPALPQTGGAPIAYTSRTQQIWIWALVTLICSVIAAMYKGFHQAKALSSKRRE